MRSCGVPVYALQVAIAYRKFFPKVAFIVP